jgi:geranylgeranyl diphosphate synthase type I
MQALVYRAVLNLEHRRLPPGTAIQLVRLVTDAILEMTEGQHLDIDFQERGHISVDQYFDMTSRKTGALLEAALRSGARIAGAQSDYEEALARFGRSFGLAFQARDDYLGVWGDSRESGKAVGADIQRKKKSLPVVFGMEQDPGGAGALIRRVMALDSISGDDIAAVIEVLDSCGAREFTEEAAVRHTRAARIALSENLPESSAREALLEIAELAAMRRV